MKLFLIFLVILVVLPAFGNDNLFEFGFKVPKLSSNGLQTNGFSSRVFNGQDANDNQFPYMILVLMRNKEGEMFRCSGSLVAKNWVLLAAHCILEGMTVDDFILVGGKARLGDYLMARLQKPFEESVQVSPVQEKRVSAFHVHPDFDAKSMSYDVALLRLKTPFDGGVTPQNISKTKLIKRDDCMILGWGLMFGDEFDGNLHYVEQVSVRTPFYGCIHKAVGPYLCLRDRASGICNGDLGSPLVCDHLTWGVASHFVSDIDSQNCGAADETFYSDLYSSREWLESYLSHGNRLQVISKKTIFIVTVMALLIFMT